LTRGLQRAGFSVEDAAMSERVPTVADAIAFLDRLAPAALAESWDNVGLLLGSRSSPLEVVLTCLTLSEDVADEAIRERASLVVTHHPVFFRPVQRITDENPEGRTILKLARAGIAVYSPHTAFDSAVLGINQRLAESLGLSEIVPLRPAAATEVPGGGGRWGVLAKGESLGEFVGRVRRVLKVEAVGLVGESSQKIQRVAVACGAAAEFLDDAVLAGCGVLLTGEARFHACLDARAKGIGLVLAGHYATERPGVEALADVIAGVFPGHRVWASRVETDPLKWSTT
jgi:dinuclear metal center YbgI/SA1388 family protein